MDNLPSDIKITKYADDIALLAQDTNPERVKILFTRAVITNQANFQAISLQLATEKTELIWFGNSPRIPRITTIQIEILTIHISD